MKIAKSHQLLLPLCLALIYLSWGSTFIGVKIALEKLSPIFLTSIRFALGGLILFIFSLLVYRKGPTRQQWIQTSFLGILLTGNGTSAIAYGIQYIPSGIVAVMVATVPIWVLLLEKFVFKSAPPNKYSIIGIFFGFIGVIVLLDPFSGMDRTLALFPSIIVFLGCVSWAFGTIKGKTMNQAPGMQSVAIQMFAGGLYALLLSFIFESNQFTSLGEIDTKTTLAIAYLIGFGSYVGYSAFTWLMNNSSPIIATSYAFVTPLVALYLGNVLGGEEFSKQILLAAAIIITSLLFITKGKIVNRKRTSS